jgi:Fe-S-cluster-containing dehydrogenase component
MIAAPPKNRFLMFAQAAQAGELGAFEGTWRDYVMNVWQTQVYSPTLFAADFTSFWNGALRDGFVDLRSTQSSARTFKAEALGALTFPSKSSGLQLVVIPSPILGEDGNANNSWSMELPHPVAKVCWTNYASLAPKTASAMTLRDGDFVKLTVEGKTIDLPVRVQPGDVEDVVTVQTGWGRKHVGRVGDGVGGNAFALCARGNYRLQTLGLSATLEATGHWEELPDVQGHNYTLGRPIIQEATFEEYLKDPHAGAFHGHELHSLWPEHEYKGNKWGMAIDQTACIGCNACVAACSVENNIPVVGIEGIRKGREMHWIRVDRYFSGTEEEPEFVFQPMLCQHCDNASCETVCPVVATIHSEEGLNMQVYNRCVGTRYCANNCPYKVRRFNFFEYSFASYEPYPLQLALNPEVTVREKGVMEKCSFCQHKIRQGKERAKEMGRTVMDSDIQTACQQSCHHELRVLDRHRPRRHADLRHSLPVPAEVAHVDQPLRRGHDDLRRHLRRHLPGHPRRPRLARVLVWFPIPNQTAIWPNFRLPLLWDVFAVSTYFTVSLLFWYVGLIPDLATLRDRARPVRRKIPTASFARLARLQPPLAALRAAYLILAALDAARALGALGRVVRLRHLGRCPAGTRRSSRPTSSPAPSSRASRW